MGKNGKCSLVRLWKNSFGRDGLILKQPGAANSTPYAVIREISVHWNNHWVGILASLVVYRRLARFNRPVMASRVGWSLTDESWDRPTSNRSYPGGISGRKSAIAALRRRLARFRFTAFPTASPALTPICVSILSDFSTYNTTSGWAYDLPERRTRLISVDRVRRKLRFTCASLYPGQVRLRLRQFRSAANLLPTNVLDVVIASDGQTDPAL
jgi:hypothetical protein